MSDSSIIISAFADEDRRLRSLVESLSPDQQIATCEDGLCVRALLCHVSAWDQAVIKFFVEKVEGNITSHTPHSFTELEEQTKHREAELLNKSFSEIYAQYIETTSKMQNFILTNWDELSEEDHNYFTIPLQHRRHHRHKLEKVLNISEEMENAITA
jgi:hypothetical protein